MASTERLTAHDVRELYAMEHDEPDFTDPRSWISYLLDYTNNETLHWRKEFFGEAIMTVSL